MEYQLEGSIKTDRRGLEKLIMISQLSPADGIIEINMRNLVFLEANLIAVLGAILFQKFFDGFKVKITNIRNEINDILERNHFINSNNEFSSDFETAMEFKIFAPDKESDFINYVDEQLLAKAQFPQMDINYKKQIRSKIQELFANAKEHGNASHIYCCGQYFPRKGVIHFTIVNLGRTIKENVCKYLNADIDSKAAIEWASKEGNSTAISALNPTRGLGLSLLHEFIKNNHGKLSIMSDNGYWFIDSKEEHSQDIKLKFLGTIVNIIINVRDKKRYEIPFFKDIERLFNKN